MPNSAPTVQQAHDHVRHQYGHDIGRRREELITPALVLDIDAAQRNIDRMASELRNMGSATIRPHSRGRMGGGVRRLVHRNQDLMISGQLGEQPDLGWM